MNESEEIKSQMRNAITAIRDDNEDLIMSCPDLANNQAQQELVKKHGTPREFARAVINAIGEISCLEAHTAIDKHNRQWKAAK